MSKFILAISPSASRNKNSELSSSPTVKLLMSCNHSLYLESKREMLKALLINFVMALSPSCAIKKEPYKSLLQSKEPAPTGK